MDNLILKNNLKQARSEKKLSQAQLAEMVGVSRNTISSIETGQFNPTAKLALICALHLIKSLKIYFIFKVTDWRCSLRRQFCCDGVFTAFGEKYERKSSSLLLTAPTAHIKTRYISRLKSNRMIVKNVFCKNL